MQPLTQTRIFSPMIAVGSDEASGTGGGKVKVYEYSEMARRWQVKIHLEWPWNVDEAKQQKETSALSSYVHIVRQELWTSSEELSWNFAFELVGRDFLNLDRPCSRHCLCPKHRPLLSCSRHCEQVNAVIILSWLVRVCIEQGLENNNSETTGRWARGCCWNSHQVRHQTGERQFSQVGQVFWYFCWFRSESETVHGFVQAGQFEDHGSAVWRVSPN